MMALPHTELRANLGKIWSLEFDRGKFGKVSYVSASFEAASLPWTKPSAAFCIFSEISVFSANEWSTHPNASPQLVQFVIKLILKTSRNNYAYYTLNSGDVREICSPLHYSNINSRFKMPKISATAYTRIWILEHKKINTRITDLKGQCKP